METLGFIPGDWREWRRLRALQLKQQGWPQRGIAEAFGVREETVSRWLARACDGGPETLRTRPVLGHPSKLSDAQKRQIPESLWHGPEAYGFSGQVWTRLRIAQVIQEEFGVRYHKAHVGRLLKNCAGRPRCRSAGPSNAMSRPSNTGVLRSGPNCDDRRRREQRVLIFEDESGFYLLAGLVRTYAPVGRPPFIRQKQTRDHLSVMGGMTPRGKVYTLARQESLNGMHCIEFLKHLQEVAGERLLVIWDGSPIHRRAEVREFVSQTKGKVRVEALPGYWPDLNPWDEGGWNHLKRVQLRTWCAVTSKSCTSSSILPLPAYNRNLIWFKPSLPRLD